MTASTAIWTRQQVIVVLTCFLLNTIDGMDLLILSYITPVLQKEWGIDSVSMGGVFSAGFVGMAIGGLAIAPLADRFGRRRLIIAALAAMTVAMILTGLAQNLTQLVLLRLVVGCATGTMLACLAALVGEYAPENRQHFAIGVVQAGYAVGAGLSALATVYGLEIIGWRGLLIGTGLISLTLLPFARLLLPESKQLLRRGEAGSRMVRSLLGKRHLRSTLLLWTVTSCGLMVVYFVASWITKLAIMAGLSQSDAIFAGAIFNVGSFTGVMLVSWLSIRFMLQRLIFFSMLLSAALLLIFGGIAMPLPLLLVVGFALGVVLQGGFSAAYPLAVSLYPPEVRATGTGWAMGIGRIGAVIGPYVGGLALEAKLPLVAVFGIFAVPLVIAAVCGLLIRMPEEPAAA